MRHLSRRSALTALGGLIVPAAAQAQLPPVMPQVTPAPGPAVAAPVFPAPALPPPGLPLPATARPQAAPAAAIDRTKHYYVFFDQQIDVNTMHLLRRQLAVLVEAGVGEITLVISSPGGLIDATVQVYGFIRALPAKISTHALGFVQSAATLLFLAGEARSADHTAQFLFHPTQFNVLGSMGDQQMRERVSQSVALGALFAQIYHERTKLPDAQIDRFAREQVIYSADEAKSYGIIDNVADLRIPGPQSARIILLE